MNVSERRGQLAILRAIGATRRQDPGNAAGGRIVAGPAGGGAGVPARLGRRLPVDGSDGPALRRRAAAGALFAGAVPAGLRAGAGGGRAGGGHSRLPRRPHRAGRGHAAAGGGRRRGRSPLAHRRRLPARAGGCGDSCRRRHRLAAAASGGLRRHCPGGGARAADSAIARAAGRCRGVAAGALPRHWRCGSPGGNSAAGPSATR